MKKCVCGNQMTKACWKRQWVCHRCGRTKPLYGGETNAEHIRNMTDDELAEWLVYEIRCSACDAENCDEQYCLNVMKEYLEQPYKPRNP